jgi:MoxR-like ATPase
MHDLLQRLRDNITSVYLGNTEAVDRVLICLLARGHLLIEDVPGVGKTVLATAVARSVDCSFSRIQLTPDMLPSDILGVSILERETGQFRFNRGPIFANIILADEINRTPPRTQAALLEAMSDAAVSIDGRTYTLDAPFMVVATQNPHDYEGTYALPENQLDRFLMRINLGYPSPEDEARVLSLRPGGNALRELKGVISREQLVKLQAATDKTLIDYIIALANATRRHEEIDVGLSPRATLALSQAARATALYRGRDYVIPDDIMFNLETVGAHRILARSGRNDADEHARLIQAAARTVPAPA